MSENKFSDCLTLAELLISYRTRPKPATVDEANAWLGHAVARVKELTADE